MKEKGEVYYTIITRDRPNQPFEIIPVIRIVDEEVTNLAHRYWVMNELGYRCGWLWENNLFKTPQKALKDYLKRNSKMLLNLERGYTIIEV